MASKPRLRHLILHFSTTAHSVLIHTNEEFRFD